MLYAREFVFNGDQQWFCHLRLDSSPQYAKNYLLGELDKISFSGNLQSDVADAFLIKTSQPVVFCNIDHVYKLFTNNISAVFSYEKHLLGLYVAKMQSNQI